MTKLVITPETEGNKTVSFVAPNTSNNIVLPFPNEFSEYVSYRTDPRTLDLSREPYVIFDNIPPGVRIIRLSFFQLTVVSSTTEFAIQLGDNADYKTTGYVTAAITEIAAASAGQYSSTSSFPIRLGPTAGMTVSGIAHICKAPNSNIYTYSFNGHRYYSTPGSARSGGSVVMDNPVTRIKIIPSVILSAGKVSMVCWS